MTHILIIARSLAASAALGLVASTAPAQSFMSLPRMAETEASIADVNADGSVVVGHTITFVDGKRVVQAFRWTHATGFVSLGVPPGAISSVAAGVSGDGSVVVGCSEFESSDCEAFRWTSETGMQALGDLPGGYFYSIARSASFDGSVVVGGASTPDGSEPFRWTAKDGMQGLGHLPNTFYSEGADVNADGTVAVGGSYCTDRGEAFRWTTQHGMQGIGDIPGDESVESHAHAVSADGLVVVGMGNYGGCGSPFGYLGGAAARWTAETGMQALPSVPGGDTGSEANDVSGDGSVVVGVVSLGWFGHQAFLWTPALGTVLLKDHLISLGVANLAGWTLSSARAISADGTTIVGYGHGPQGEGYSTAWIARLSGGDPACPADFNNDTRVNSQDVFDFLAAFFADALAADFNHDAVINSQDLFDFLTAFFAGC